MKSCRRKTCRHWDKEIKDCAYITAPTFVKNMKTNKHECWDYWKRPTETYFYPNECGNDVNNG